VPARALAKVALVTERRHVPLLRTRVGLAFGTALLTGLFAFVFAWAWTDELVAGSPYAEADPVGAAIEGALAGLVPLAIGLALCALLLWTTGVAWWWPTFLVLGAAGVGAVLGASARFSEGMPALVTLVFAVGIIAGGVGLVADARYVLHRTCGNLPPHRGDGDRE
jgi:hypothetical protein